MKRLPLAIIFPAILFFYPAQAQQTSINPQTQGEVAFVSGGIGKEEQAQMQALQSSYNLSLLFSAAGSGEYLSDVGVRIEDAKKNVCLETVANGPMFFARLKPGRYSLQITSNGNIRTIKVTLAANKQNKLTVSMP